MSATDRPPATTGIGPALERWLEAGLFGSRWLMAPFYVGLVVALPILLWVFVASGVFLALMDWLHGLAEKTEAEAHAVQPH